MRGQFIGRPVAQKWDGQAEHAPNNPKIARAPMFSYDDHRLSGRINISLVCKGYEVAEKKIDNETSDALAALQTVADDSTLWFELPIERGYLQFLNKSIGRINTLFSLFHQENKEIHDATQP
jgi:hypothetical protein